MELNEKLKSIGREIARMLLYLGIAALFAFLGIFLMAGNAGLDEVAKALMMSPIATAATFKDLIVSSIIIDGLWLAVFGAIYLLWKLVDVVVSALKAAKVTFTERKLSPIVAVLAKNWIWLTTITVVVVMMRINLITEIGSLIILATVGAYAVIRVVVWVMASIILAHLNGIAAKSAALPKCVTTKTYRSSKEHEEEL